MAFKRLGLPPGVTATGCLQFTRKSSHFHTRPLVRWTYHYGSGPYQQYNRDQRLTTNLQIIRREWRALNVYIPRSKVGQNLYKGLQSVIHLANNGRRCTVSVDQMSVDRMSVDQMCVDQIAFRPVTRLAVLHRDTLRVLRTRLEQEQSGNV